MRRGFVRLRSQELRRGFALIEILLVIAMLGVITGMGIPLYRDYQIRSDLNLASEQISQGMGRAKILSQSGKEDTEWGFYVPGGVLFHGKTYATRDPEDDMVYPMPSTVSFSGITEVSFSKLDGTPSSTGSVVVKSLKNEQQAITVSLTQMALPTNEDDKLTICHKPNTPACQTKEIPDAAWPGHEGHGDHLGACTSDDGDCD